MERVSDKKAPLMSCCALMHKFKLILWYFSQYRDVKLNLQKTLNLTTGKHKTIKGLKQEAFTETLHFPHK